MLWIPLCRACLCASVIMMVARPQLIARGPKVHRDVRQQLDRQGRAVACVVLRDDAGSRDPAWRKMQKYAAVQERVLSALPRGAYNLRYRFRSSPILVLEVLEGDLLEELGGRPDVKRVDLDARGTGALLESRELIGANDVRDLEILGAGRFIAVLDSGVETDHPDLAEAIVLQKRFLDSGGDVGDTAEDGHGHGTNVAGIIAGRGRVAEPGIAPRSLLVVVKVLDDFNNGFLSDWAAGVEYVADLHEDGLRIEAINMSLMSNATFEAECDGFVTAFSAACRRAQDLGIAIFAASGNSGSSSSMTSPACYSAVFAVGSSFDSLPDGISAFTNRNALLDLLAPGQSITSAGRDGGTSLLSGTSQAAPHATAVASLLREVKPYLTPERILDVLQVTGVPVLDPGTGLVFPRIDALAAVTAVATSADCNENGVRDVFDLADGVSHDCDGNRTPDECDIALGASEDCNGNGVPDSCDLADGSSGDANGNGVPDECDAGFFNRGDPNDDGSLDVSDAICILNFLFRGGPSPGCMESADANNDGVLDVSDGIGLVHFLWLGGPPPPAPGPPGFPCGFDVDEPGSPEDLGCDVYRACTE